MKKTFYFKLCYVSIFALGMGLFACNKIMTPPDITGTWGVPRPYIRPVENFDALGDDFTIQQAVTAKINDKFNDELFWDDFKFLIDYYEDYPLTLSFGQENVFSFIYNSGLTLTGTYKQDFYTFAFQKTESPPNFVYGEFNDYDHSLWLHLFDKTQAKDGFYYAVMNLYGLDEEEQAAYEIMIAGYHIGMIYKKVPASI